MRELFFLAFKKYFYVRGRWETFAARQGVYRREQGWIGALSSLADRRIDTPFRIEWTFQRFKRNYLAIRRPIAQRGPRASPVLACWAEHWLHGIAGHCVLSTGWRHSAQESSVCIATRRRKVAIDYRRSASNIVRLSMKPRCSSILLIAQHARDIGRIAGYIRQRKQLRIAAHISTSCCCRYSRTAVRTDCGERSCAAENPQQNTGCHAIAHRFCSAWL